MLNKNRKYKEFIRLYLPKNISFDFKGVPPERNIIIFASKTLGVPFKDIGKIELDSRNHFADIIYYS